jgi:hypothetical protein
LENIATGAPEGARRIPAKDAEPKDFALIGAPSPLPEGGPRPVAKDRGQAHASRRNGGEKYCVAQIAYTRHARTSNDVKEEME